MSTALRVMFLVSIFLTYSCSPMEKGSVGALLIDMEYLDNAKNRLDGRDAIAKVAYNQLIEDAEAALLEGPYTVTDKERLPPSGNNHDYASYSRYWWPDPQQSDGLPYIRRDGETNPASQSLSTSDRPRIGALGLNTEALGLAYYLSGEKKYAEKAAELLRTWFLDESTRMNPNLNHAQCRPGHNDGSKSGVLDGRLMIRALEGGLLIAESSVLSEEEVEGLQSWASQYYDWLTTSELALQERQSKNNHGSWYDVQVLYFALYCGKKDEAKALAEQFVSGRVTAQIQPDGSMPEELARTRPLFYSIYNMHAMSLVASIAEKVGVDVWEANEATSRLKAGMDYVTPYADSTVIWPLPAIRQIDRMELLPLLQMAYRTYHDEKYLELIDKLPLEERSLQRCNIAFPLMR